MILIEWLSLVLICVMGVMLLGLSLVVVLKYSLYGGMKNGMLVVLSYGIGVGFYVCVLLFGLGVLMM